MLSSLGSARVQHTPVEQPRTVTHTVYRAHTVTMGSARVPPLSEEMVIIPFSGLRRPELTAFTHHTMAGLEGISRQAVL